MWSSEARISKPNSIYFGGMLSLKEVFHERGNTLICLPLLGNPFYYDYLIDIIGQIQDPSKQLILAPLPYSGIKRFSLESRLERARKFFLDEITRIHPGIRIIPPTVENKPETLDLISKLTFAGELRKLDKPYKFLGSSLNSTFSSSLSMSSSPYIQLKPYMNQLLDYSNQYQMIFWYLNNILKQIPEIKDVILFNGRFPDQAPIIEVAELLKVKWWALEHGSKPGERFFLENFRTQDRRIFQEHVENLFLTSSRISRMELEAIGLRWLQNQESDPKQNEFLRRPRSKELRGPREDLVGIFTSSLDEGISLPGWNDDDIEVLADKSFDIFLKLRNKGLIPLLVIHPNTMNKKWDDLGILLRKFADYEDSIIYPWDALSSYEILKQSKFVVTWRSTIGLEAIARGKNLILLSHSHYDAFLDIPIWDTTASIDIPENIDLDNVSRALFLLGYLSMRGTKIREFNKSETKISSEIHNLLPLGNRMKSLKNKLGPFIIPFPFRNYTPNQVSRFLNYFLPVKKVNSVLKVIALR